MDDALPKCLVARGAARARFIAVVLPWDRRPPRLADVVRDVLASALRVEAEAVDGVVVRAVLPCARRPSARAWGAG